MTINEFRAWLDGFKEAIGEAPTSEQWGKVLAKLRDVQEPFVPPTFGVGSGQFVPSPRRPDLGFGSLHVQPDPSTRVTNGSRAYVNGQDAGPSD